MLMDTNLDPCQLNYAQTAHDSGKDLISLINKVLDQAKIESGRLELEAVPFDLRAVLDKVLSIFSGKSHEKGIEVNLSLPLSVCAILNNWFNTLCNYCLTPFSFPCWNPVGCLCI